MPNNTVIWTIKGHKNQKYIPTHYFRWFDDLQIHGNSIQYLDDIVFDGHFNIIKEGGFEYAYEYDANYNWVKRYKSLNFYNTTYLDCERTIEYY